MATTEIGWGDGSGEKFYLTYSSASGNQTVVVTSDANTGDARSKVVTFSASGAAPVMLTVSQAAGGPAYVRNGLVFWLDGIDKGNSNTAWVEKISGHSFTNHGAVFNTNHVYFDGVDDYLMSTTGAKIGQTVGTIEVVYERESYYGIIYMPDGFGLACGFVSGYDTLFSTSTSKPKYRDTPSIGNMSVSETRALGNGVAMLQNSSSSISGAVSGEYYVGKRNYSSNPGYFHGKIYSIRIYDRKLTEAEVLQNYAVDLDRFGLSELGYYICPTSYDENNYAYASISNPSRGYVDENTTTYCQFGLVTGSQAESYVYFKFDTSCIPSNATITSVSCVAKGYISNTSTNNIQTRNMQLCSGTTLKGEASGELTNTATQYAISGGTWTRQELSDVRLRCYAKRGANNTGTSYNFRFYGATLSVTYTI